MFILMHGKHTSGNSYKGQLHLPSLVASEDPSVNDMAAALGATNARQERSKKMFFIAKDNLRVNPPSNTDVF